MNWEQAHQKYEVSHQAHQTKAHKLLANIEEREEFMEALRRYKQTREREHFAQYELGQLDFVDLGFELTALAESCLQEAYLYENNWLKSRYGSPQSHFHMVAMGKFGACEMTLQSDLDLIFIFAEPKRTTGPEIITNQEYFVKLIQRVISNISALTRVGRAYEVDAELRPSGRSGILVTSWETFHQYHQTQAQSWEKQALLKARPIEPDPNVWAGVNERLMQQIWQAPFGDDLAQEMHRLRQRMELELGKETANEYHLKVGYGGLVDIEFTVQYLQLSAGGKHTSLRCPHTLLALDLLAEAHLLSPEQTKTLKANYLFYRRLETRLRQFNERSSGRLEWQKSVHWEKILEKLGYQNLIELRKDYETFREETRQIYQQVLGL